MKLGCVLMAAGGARRFGSDKLLVPFGGKPLYLCALDAIPAAQFAAVTVVAHAQEVLDEARRRGFSAVVNDCPEAGVSRTIRLGLEALPSVDAALFLVADQPLLTRASIEGLIAFYRAHPAHIVALSAGGRRGNPVLFPKRFFGALASLTGDVGGSAVIKQNEGALLLYPAASEGELFDIDRAADLAALQQRAQGEELP